MLMARSRSARSGSTDERQTFEEGEQGVGCPVATGVAIWGCEAVEGALFEREVGVQVDVRGALLFVAEPERDRGGVDAGVGGSVGDAYDNALAESFVDSVKTELIADRVWRSRAQLELAVVGYIGWFNHTRLHERLGDLPPAEFEAQVLRAQAAPQAVEGQITDGRPLRCSVASEILIS